MTNPKIEGDRVPVQTATPEAAALDIIRTETVLSRLPVHNLSKKGSIKIRILQKTESGEIELLWDISPSRDYGEPRQLAYKLDTIVINQRIDEAGRPLPKILRLGSLNEICNELGIAKQGGKSKNEIKRAFFQNVGALINAKFNYRANDGTERRLEAGFTRYSVIFTGEKLPDGRKADAVYVVLNEPFWEVLNNAPVRPLDRTYMKELPPAAQRFYEIISRKIFAALKNHYPSAKISYSEYCTFSAQLRHFERQPVQDQMAKVLRPHKKSGYITGVRYEATIDEQNQPDWILYLTPGPKAHDEFAAAHGHRRRKALAPKETEVGDSQPRRPRESSSRPEPIAVKQSFDPQLMAEFTRRGISEQKAQELLANLKPGQDKDVIAQLEHAEQTVKRLEPTDHRVINPPGFIIRLIELNTPLPDGFETSAQRQVREENERQEQARRAARDAREQLELEYERYCAAEVDRYIEANQAEFEAIKNVKLAEESKLGTPSWTKTSEITARWSARSAIQRKLALPTFEEFVDHRKQGTDFSLKPVAVSTSPDLPSAGPEHEVAAGDPVVAGAAVAEGETEEVPESVTLDAARDSVPDSAAAAEERQATTATNGPAAKEEGSDVAQEPAERVPPPGSDPVILFASDPPPEHGTDPIGPDLA